MVVVEEAVRKSRRFLWEADFPLPFVQHERISPNGQQIRVASFAKKNTPQVVDGRRSNFILLFANLRGCGNG